MSVIAGWAAWGGMTLLLLLLIILVGRLLDAISRKG